MQFSPSTTYNCDVLGASGFINMSCGSAFSGIHISIENFPNWTSLSSHRKLIGFLLLLCFSCAFLVKKALEASQYVCL